MKESSSPRSRRPLAAIFVTVLLDLLGFGIILPLIPFYAQHFGASPIGIGVLFSSYSLAQLVCAPLLGLLSDRRGRRPVILLSLGVSIGAYLLFAAAGSFGILLLARSIAGAAAANYSTAQAFVADVTTAEDRSKGMGMLGAAFGLGFVCGPAIGGLVGLWGHTAVALTAAGLALFNLILAFFWLDEPERKGLAVDRAPSLRRLAAWRRSPVSLGLMALFFLVTFAFTLMESTLALYCQRVFGFGQVETSWVFVFTGVVLVIVQGGLVARLVRRFGERRLIPWAIASTAAGLLLLPIAPLLGALLAATALLAGGYGLYASTANGLLSRLTSDESQGETLGLARSFGALARVLGPPAGTLIFATLGAAWPFWSAGLLMALTVVLAVAVLRRPPPSTQTTTATA